MKSVQDLSGSSLTTICESVIISQFKKIQISTYISTVFICNFRHSYDMSIHSAVQSINKHAVITYISGPG